MRNHRLLGTGLAALAVSVTVAVTDARGATATAGLSLPVAAPGRPAPTISPPPARRTATGRATCGTPSGRGTAGLAVVRAARTGNPARTDGLRKIEFP